MDPGPVAAVSSITWKPVKNTGSLSQPRSAESETPGVKSSNMGFNSPEGKSNACESLRTTHLEIKTGH